jgi:hypothetical protein
MVAGCTGIDESVTGGTGTFNLMISDQPAAIGSFDSLDVTFSAARVFRATDDEDLTPRVVNETTNESTAPSDADTDEPEGDGSEQAVEFDLGGVSVDLTKVKGDRAVSVLEGQLEAGEYSGIELRVSDAGGVVDGEDVGVMVPSDRLRIVRPFSIGDAEELNFVFDINVIQKGPRGSYNLLPVIGKSGVAGDDVNVEEVRMENAQ